MTKLLTESEFKSTFSEKMNDVTKTGEPVVDIWPYVHELTLEKVVNQDTYENGHVAYVWRNDKDTFEHVLLQRDDKNIFDVIIVDLVNRDIKGHYRLDLNKEFGLT